MKDIVLQTTEFKKSHSAENVAEVTDNILQEYNVSHESVLPITTDNTGNYINAVERHLQVTDLPAWRTLLTATS